ncbi:malonate decarboxylase holo-[acyl-carrier-protein] synthase [Microvirga sp. W0021]|uniref:Malonate decarboxylase holo-[acyl-carrier-protein] synthase n=1 Tax=Hohaiivirga grylli TaxID=3133970 RepID=A0ABV0BLX5_9HYPH
MTDYARHTLIDVTDAGRERILRELLPNPETRATLAQLEETLLPSQNGTRIPGIVRRDPEALAQRFVPIGFSSCTRYNGDRLRLAAAVRPDEILKVTTPFEIPPSTTPRTAALAAYQALYNEAQQQHVRLGLWGSTAMELYTGLPYSKEDSDLDLLISLAPLSILNDMLEQAKTTEERFSLRIDFELSLPNGYGIHLKELLLTENKGLVGKGMNDVAIIKREEILALLNSQK